jgi:carbohydrate diacid regulator
MNTWISGGERLLFPKLAAKIVSEVRKLLDEEIIVMDTNGVIIAGTDDKRIGHLHEGALLTLEKRRKFIITEEDIISLKGVKAGINLPIFFQQEVIGVIGITGDPMKVTPYGEIIRKMTELLISENYYTEQFESHYRSLESFILDWLQLKERDDSFLNKAMFFDIKLNLNRVIAIIQFKQTTQPLTRDEWSSIFTYLNPLSNDIATRFGSERMLLILDGEKNVSRRQLENKLINLIQYLEKNFGVIAYVGIGQKTSAMEIGHSYRNAERALKSTAENRKIVFDEDLTIEMIMDELSLTTKAEFIKRTIGSISTDKELLDTIKELMSQNHSLKKTAENLHIHINTLHYRLKKLEEMTGLNHQNSQDILSLYFSLQLLDKHPNILE